MLRLLDGFDVLHHAHPSAAMWIEAVGREAWGAALTFTLVRDPWARAVSLFEQRVSMCSDETSDGDSSDSDSSGDSSGDGSDGSPGDQGSSDSSYDDSCANCADGKLNFTSAACSMLRTPPRLHTYCTRTARAAAHGREAPRACHCYTRYAHASPRLHRAVSWRRRQRHRGAASEDGGAP